MTHEHHHHKRFNPANLQRLEDPDRDQLFPVDRILSLAGIKPQMTVVDIGVGTGYFAIPIAKLVAPHKLYGVDVSSEMLDYLRNKLSQPTMPRNIELMEGEATATSLPDGGCDVVFISAVWHEIDDAVAVLAEFARILKPDGRLVLVDWSPDGVRPPGPPLEHRIALQTVRQTLTGSKWKTVHAEPLNASIYLVVAQRP
jgi:ubiquinone/menaquinone biosynthesis C-methylase UbiE